MVNEHMKIIFNLKKKEKKEVWQLNILALLAFLSVCVEFMPNTKNVYIV